MRNGEYVLMDEAWWNGDEKWYAKVNLKVLNSIFCLVEPNLFHLIAACEIAKDA